MQSELVRWLDDLRALSSIAAGGQGLSEGLDLVASTTRELLGFDFCGVLTPDPRGVALLITGSSGLSRQYVERINQVNPVGLASTAPSSRAFLLGVPVAVEDIATDAGFGPWGGVAGEQGYRSMISVPLRGGEGVLGTLNGYRADTHVYTEQEIEQLTLLANHAATALHSARLVEELRAANASLLDQREILTRSEEIHERLLRSALQSGGVEGVLRTLADVTSRSVLLEGSRREVLAEAGDDSARLRGIVRLTGGEVPDGALLTPVRLSNEEVARLWVSDPAGTGVDAVEERAIDHAAVVVALEILRERTALETEYRIRGELLTDILHDGVTEQTMRRAASMGHDLRTPHFAIVVQLPGQGEQPTMRDADARRALRAIDDLAQSTRVTPLAAVHQGRIVVFWPMESDAATTDAAAAAVHDAIGRVFPGAAVLSAGSGRHRTTVADAYRVARGALELARGSGRTEGFVTPDGMGVVGLILQLEHTDSLATFARARLAGLLTYDSERGTELVLTLRMLVAEGMDRAEVARALRLHPNTVAQRIRRIEVLSGSRLDRPADVVELSSALSVLAVVEAQSEA